MLLPELLGLWLLALGLAGAARLPPEDFETVRTSNAAILNRLGLVAADAPDGHHRKRLAGPHPNLPATTHHHHHQHHQKKQQQQQRHIAAHQDSHVYVVKLPASPAYYSFARPHRKSELLGAGLAASSLGKQPSVGFQGNGKPGKLYHWNLPIVRKLATGAKLRASKLKLLALATHQQRPDASPKPSRSNDKWLLAGQPLERPRANASSPTTAATTTRIELPMASKAYRVVGPGEHHHQQQQQPLRSKSPARTNELPGAFDLSSSFGLKAARKHRKKAATSYYYAPDLAGKSLASNKLQKHFPGNGKPKAFYVMEKSRKPVYYHPLLP